MRETASHSSFVRARQGCGRFLVQIARIGLALSLVIAFFNVNFALARANVPATPGITSCMADMDHSCDVLAVEHAAHLAGHLTGIVDAACDALAIDATRTRTPIMADSLPRSTPLPAPSEPPRA